MLGNVVNSHLAVSLVVTGSDVNAAHLHLVFTSDQDVVPLSQLRISDLLVDLTLGSVKDALVAEFVEVQVDTLTVVESLFRNGAHDNLTRRKPERPLASQMLDQDGGESLHGSKDSSVHNNGSLEARLEGLLLPLEVFAVEIVSLEDLRAKLLLDLLVFVGSVGLLDLGGVFALVLKVEPDGKLEIQLHGSALVRSLKRIVDLDVNLRSVKSTITGVELPWHAKSVESIFQGLLSLVPKVVTSESLLGSGGEFKLKLELEDAVDVPQEVEAAHNFSHELLRGAEQMRVILTEATHSGQAGEST